METTMELDELRSAWQALDRRLAQQSALSLQNFKLNRLDRMRSGFWPMRLGQMARIAFGIALMSLAVPVWVGHWPQPFLVACGLAVHIYAIAECVIGGRNLWLIGAIDYAAPILTIQQQLARLRNAYLRSSFWLGNAWWVMWAPLLFVLVPWENPWLPDSAMYGPGPWRFALTSTTFGILAIVLVVWLMEVWRRRNPKTLRKFEDQSSRGIARARELLNEIAVFERE